LFKISPNPSVKTFTKYLPNFYIYQIKVKLPSTLKLYQNFEIWYIYIPVGNTDSKCLLNLNSMDVLKAEANFYFRAFGYFWLQVPVESF